MNSHIEGSTFPTREQELLLRASLLQGDPALQAWRNWKALVNVEQKLDAGSYRLLPLLYHNLQLLGVDDPLMSKLRGIYRRTWYKNQILFHHMAVVLDRFEKAGTKTMILKGAALVLLHYKNFGLRPMEDFDVLVPTAQTSEAIHLLMDLNWNPHLGSELLLRNSFRSTLRSHPFEDGAGRKLDLHWHLLLESRQEDADDDFWEGTLPVRLDGVHTKALNPTDQLLHVCVSGASWNRTPPLRWAADAVTILGTSGDIDWTRLVAQAGKRHLILPLGDTLTYLRDALGAPVPGEVLRSLKALPISRVDRIAHRAKNCPEDRRGPILNFWRLYECHLRSVNNPDLRHKFLGFPKFVQAYYGLVHMWQVPFVVAYRTVRNIRRKWSM